MLSYGARAYSLDDVEFLARGGFSFAEIDLKDEVTVRSHSDRLREFSRRCGIGYLGHGPNEKDPYDVDEIEAHMEPRVNRLLDLAPGLGIRIYTQHLKLDPRQLDAAAVRRKTAVLRRWCEHAGRLGVTFCIENLSEHSVHFGPAFEAIAQLRLTLDVGHGELLSEVNAALGFIEEFPDRIHHVHLHDNFGGDSSKSDLHLPIGRGSIDFADILRRLVGVGYRGGLCLEVRREHVVEGRERIMRMIGD